MKLIGNKGTVEIDGRKYYFKRNDDNVEILVEQIEKLFGLNHAHYTPITVNGTRYYISEDLNEIGPFITAFDARIDSSNINDISFLTSE